MGELSWFREWLWTSVEFMRGKAKNISNRLTTHRAIRVLTQHHQHNQYRLGLVYQVSVSRTWFHVAIFYFLFGGGFLWFLFLFIFAIQVYRAKETLCQRYESKKESRCSNEVCSSWLKWAVAKIRTVVSAESRKSKRLWSSVLLYQAWAD